MRDDRVHGLIAGLGCSRGLTMCGSIWFWQEVDDGLVCVLPLTCLNEAHERCAEVSPFFISPALRLSTKLNLSVASVTACKDRSNPKRCAAITQIKKKKFARGGGGESKGSRA